MKTYTFGQVTLNLMQIMIESSSDFIIKVDKEDENNKQSDKDGENHREAHTSVK